MIYLQVQKNLNYLPAVISILVAFSLCDFNWGFACHMRHKKIH